MNIIVQKYGGTSVGSIERIENVAKRIIRQKKRGDSLVIVVSAMSGETNRLISLAHEIAECPDPLHYDMLFAAGEQVSIALLAIALIKKGIEARAFLGYQVHIVTDRTYKKARIKLIEKSKIIKELEAGSVVIVAGCQGVDEEGNITTLGRGGSDTTAIALAAALNAMDCEIYTDVDGVYTSDPRIVLTARKIDKLTFDEMLEMASLGAKVLQIRSCELAKKYCVPLRVRSSFNNTKGTYIGEEVKKMEERVISAVCIDKDQARFTLLGLPFKPNIMKEIFGPLSERSIVIDMIVQNPPMGNKINLSFTVSKSDYHETKKILKKLKSRYSDSAITDEQKIAKISVVGVGMVSQSGVAHTMFDILGKHNIPIKMISTSEIKISCIVDLAQADAAANALHTGFGLDNKRT